MQNKENNSPSISPPTNFKVLKKHSNLYVLGHLTLYVYVQPVCLQLFKFVECEVIFSVGMFEVQKKIEQFQYKCLYSH